MLNSGAPCGGVERLARRRVQPAAKPPAGTREGEVCDRRKPDLIGSERQQEMRDSIRSRQIGIGDFDAVAVDATAAGPDQHGAGLSHNPGPEPRPLEHQPRAPLKLAGVVIEQVAEEPERDALGCCGPRSPATQHLGASRGVQLGNDPGVGERQQQYRSQDGLERGQQRRDGQWR
jgi:hypothetical protein